MKSSRAKMVPVPVLAYLALLATVPSHAEETARKTNELLGSVAAIARDLELADVPSPIDITADRMEFRYGQGVLRYEGSVYVEHAGARIRARSLEVSFEPEGRRGLRKITARGGVEVINGNETARGELAEYDPVAGTIVLSQNARLGSGQNSLVGEKVVVYLNERRAVVQGGGGGSGSAPAAADGGPVQGAAAPDGRVRVVIMPDAPPGSEKKKEGK